jgi:hypothetical protein
MTRDELIEAAARAMLAYEAWLKVRPATAGGNDVRFPGQTGDEILTAVTGPDIREWARLAAAAIERAAELRGCSATASRVRGQRERSQATGRRTIPKKIRRAA